ncbi:MAG: electron transport complex subunit RsxC [Clostridia bacterium]|nr:electron transport complex subunit RsxC [Clostridia bacterium]
MAFSLRGIHVPHRKNTAKMSAVRMPAPQSVTLLTVMHIGRPATPVVKVGTHVDVGTLVAEQSGLISSPVYASVSGTVKKITEEIVSTGARVPAITIESDGAMTVDASIAPPVVNSKEDFIEALKKSGIVGLGGAGFPTYVKFMTDKPVDTLVINGAECEPYITSDTRTMIEKADEIRLAIETADKYMNFAKIIIGIEKNKPEAIEKMQELAKSNNKIQVAVLPSVYPQGGEKVLVYHTTGKKIKLGQLPADVGCIVSNISTLAAIGDYLKTGMPLVERLVTVDGGAVKEPKNVLVPVGTPVKDVFEFCGGFTVDPEKVLYGGPMMGITVPDLDVPVLKQTNALLAFTEKEAKMPKTTACIHCGTCVNSCPFGINVLGIAKGLQIGDMDMVEKAGVETCMECGCCAFGCPANRPIVQNNKLAKLALRDHKAKEAKA